MIRRWALLLGAGLFALQLVFFPGCVYFKLRENTFFQKEDYDILQKTTAAIDYDYGWDNRLAMNYVFSLPAGNATMDAREKELQKVIKSVNVKRIETFYFKMMRLQSAISNRIERFKKKKVWYKYTYLKEELRPRMDRYLELMRKYISMIDPAFEGKLKMEQIKSDRWAEWYYKYDDDPVDTF